MFDSIITDYIKDAIGSPKLNFGRLSWVWNDASGNTLLLDKDKPNLVDGFLIINFGITTTGAAGVIFINDDTVNQIVYRGRMTPVENLISPFVYFVKGNTLSFTCNQRLYFGFNYFTVSGENK